MRFADPFEILLAAEVDRGLYGDLPARGDKRRVWLDFLLHQAVDHLPETDGDVAA